MLKTYYALTKPGIIYGNIVNATAGFLLAAVGAKHLNLWLLLATLGGTSLVIASGCVFNNYMDRDIDKKMARTQKRASVQGLVSLRNAMIFATVLCVAGFAILVVWANWLVVIVGTVGFIDYVLLYTYWKRHSVYGTLVGSISGATPPLAGYLAVTNHVDAAAVIIFLILVFWQMPHFYAIAIYRLKDYTAAGIPVWPAKKGIRATKIQILLYIIGFGLVAQLLTAYGYTGWIYSIVLAVISLVWLKLAVQGFSTPDDAKWARKLFFFSLVVTIAVAVMLPLGALLP